MDSKGPFIIYGMGWDKIGGAYNVHLVLWWGSLVFYNLGGWGGGNKNSGTTCTLYIGIKHLS